MARYTGRRTEALMIRLEPELKAELIQLASSEDRSTGELVRRLIRIGLAAYHERPAYGRKSSRLSADQQGDASSSAYPGAQG